MGTVTKGASALESALRRLSAITLQVMADHHDAQLVDRTEKEIIRQGDQYEVLKSLWVIC